MTKPKRPAAPVDDVRVRMYRQGLGDCFLLTFPGEDGQNVHMLIDCGVWDADEATMTQMEKVVQNIRDDTGGHLHVLACTHEHWDHNSGFLQQQALFEEMTIDHVWLAWTENPKDGDAAALKAEYEAKRQRLARAVSRLRGVNAHLAEQIASLAGLAESADLGAKKKKGVRADPSAAMKWVRDRGEHGAKVAFCEPGEVRAIPGVADARAFVLGPPKSRKLLRKNLATKRETEEGDVYHLRFANSYADSSYFAAVDNSGKEPTELAKLSGDELDAYNLSLPFDPVHRVAPKAASAIPLVRSSYNAAAQAWRRIDDAWLDAAAQIALRMDSSTNNTSLVLAIELDPAKKILLFVADAQVGNWKSWREVKFPKPYDRVDADDLLSRTVLYKVGHHGSHNATLRKDGLKKMTDEGLVAMIPVNKASVDKKGWKMPFRPMYVDLEAATFGRIVRADDGVQERPKGFPVAPYNEFKKRCTTTDAYVEYRVP